MSNSRFNLVFAAALIVALGLVYLAENIANDVHRAADAVVQSAHYADAAVDRLAADAEAACEHLSALPEQTADRAGAPALSALRSLSPFARPQPAPTPTPPHP